MGYYPRYVEQHAGPREWAVLVLIVVVLYAAIYLPIAVFTGWWPL